MAEKKTTEVKEKKTPAPAIPKEKAEAPKTAAKPAAKATAEVKAPVKAEAKPAAKAAAEAKAAPAPKAAATKPAAEAKVPAKAEAKPVKAAAVPAAEQKPVKTAAKSESNKALKVTLVRSTNGCLKNQIATVAALGLRKIRQQKVHPDNPAMRGMIFKVRHLVEVEEITL